MFREEPAHRGMTLGKRWPHSSGGLRPSAREPNWLHTISPPVFPKEKQAVKKILYALAGYALYRWWSNRSAERDAEARARKRYPVPAE